MDGVVAPFDHKYAVPLLALSVTLAPGQSVVDPLAVMTGTGADPTFTATALEVELQPLE
jgi:hypothetical protein